MEVVLVVVEGIYLQNGTTMLTVRVLLFILTD